MCEPLQVIFKGRVDAPLLKLDAPISFWGGVDQYTGTIIDRTHPQAGVTVAGKLLVVPMVRGSGGTPGSLATLMKLGNAPAGLVLNQFSINVLTAVIVGEKLYGVRCPVFLATEDQSRAFTQKALCIDEDGRLC